MLPAGAIEFGVEIELWSGEEIVIAGEGPGATTLSGSQRTRLFSVWNGTGLTLADMSLANGTSGMDTEVCGTVHVYYGCGGGAVYAYEARITLLRCIVRENAAYVRVRRHARTAQSAF